MTKSPSTTSRSLALAGLAILVLALILSLMLFLGQGGCAPAAAFDRPQNEPEKPRETLELAREAGGRPEPTDAMEAAAGSHGSRDAAAVALNPVRGFVADAVTRELVPDVEVELVVGTTRERIVVGADGHFTSVTGMPAGDLRAIVRDDGYEVGRAEIAHGASTLAWRVAVPIGPTVRIASIDGLPCDPAAWRGRIRESALDDEVAGEIDVGAEGLSVQAPSADLPDRDWPYVRVRPGAQPWLRYPRQIYPSVKGVGARVELRDEQQNRKGTAKLAGTLGVQPTVEIRASSFGRVVYGIRRDAQHSSRPMRAVLFDAKDMRAPTPFEERVVASDGSVDFDDLEPGQKTLVAWSQTELLEDSFLVSAGPTSPRPGKTARVAREPVQASFREPRGVLPYRWSGEPELLTLVPRSAESRLRGWIAPTTNVDELGDVMPRQGTRDLTYATRARVLPGSAARSSPSSARHVFHLYSGSTDVELAGTIAIGPSGQVFLREGRASASPFEAPERVVLSWSAWAAGMQPVFGTQWDFAKREDGSRVATARFERGAGFEILVRAGDPQLISEDPWPWPADTTNANRAEYAALAAAPIAGVRVEVDTYAAGASNANGEIQIRHAILPRRITLVAKGWRLCALDRLPDGLPRYVAWLRRNP